jgi:hypothetical protein
MTNGAGCASRPTPQVEHSLPQKRDDYLIRYHDCADIYHADCVSSRE